MSTLEELATAIEKGDLTRVRELISNGININLSHIDDETPLGVAAYLGNLEIVQILIEAGADINMLMLNEGATAVMNAVSGGHFVIVEALVEAGANVNVQDYQGNTPISLAAYNKNEQIFNYLAPRTQLEWREDAERMFQSDQEQPSAEGDDWDEAEYFKYFGH